MIARIKCETCTIVGQFFEAPVFVAVEIEYANIFSEFQKKKHEKLFALHFDETTVNLFTTHRLLIAINVSEQLLKPVKMNGTRFLCSSNVHSVSCTDKKRLCPNVQISIRN